MHNIFEAVAANPCNHHFCGSCQLENGQKLILLKEENLIYQNPQDYINKNHKFTQNKLDKSNLVIQNFQEDQEENSYENEHSEKQNSSEDDEYLRNDENFNENKQNQSLIIQQQQQLFPQQFQHFNISRVSIMNLLKIIFINHLVKICFNNNKNNNLFNQENTVKIVIDQHGRTFNVHKINLNFMIENYISKGYFYLQQNKSTVSNPIQEINVNINPNFLCHRKIINFIICRYVYCIKYDEPLFIQED